MISRWIVLAAVLATACTTELPDVDPGQFACVDNTVFDDTFPCVSSDTCFEGQCTPRLNCTLPSGTPGCTGPADPGLGVNDPAPTRCEYDLQIETVAVRCEPGVHTVTSTRPRDPMGACDCSVDPAAPEEENLLCATLAGEPVNGAYPLYVLPGGGALPNAALGVPAEIEDTRLCVRACSSDTNCPASHTCRPAAVVDAALLAGPSDARHVLGVCYPNILVPTSSVVEQYQPDPLACAKPVDCGQANGTDTCSLRVQPTPDHPYAPIGEAWAGRRGFVGRCVNRSGLVGPGTGCTQNAANCQSGICFGGSGGFRCAQICDPNGSNVECGLCLPRLAERNLGPEGQFADLVHLCDR